MEFQELDLPGCYLIYPDVFTDERGLFVKIYQQELFREKGGETTFSEQYFTYSHNGVLRGLHFQLPPHEHIKLVTCLTGSVMDVVVDLREGSPTFGQWRSCDLNDQNRGVLLIPKGFAHGFYVLSQGALMLYNVSTVYNANSDSGIRWNSLGIEWPLDSDPILSQRDQSFPLFQDFNSPFRYLEF